MEKLTKKQLLNTIVKNCKKAVKKNKVNLDEYSLAIVKHLNFNLTTDLILYTVSCRDRSTKEIMRLTVDVKKGTSVLDVLNELEDEGYFRIIASEDDTLGCPMY